MPALRRRCRKTRLCRYYPAGLCGPGEECFFAHGPDELLPVPDLRCTKLCPTVLSGGDCTVEGCVYAHSESELRPRVPCPGRQAKEATPEGRQHQGWGTLPWRAPSGQQAEALWDLFNRAAESEGPSGSLASGDLKSPPAGAGFSEQSTCGTDEPDLDPVQDQDLDDMPRGTASTSLRELLLCYPLPTQQHSKMRERRWGTIASLTSAFGTDFETEPQLPGLHEGPKAVVYSLDSTALPLAYQIESEWAAERTSSDLGVPMRASWRSRQRQS